MIIDNIRNAGFYSSSDNTTLSRAFDYLLNTDFSAVQTGRHEIDGDNIYAMVSEYEPKNRDECLWEAHKKYIDVQYIAEGSEKMGYANVRDLGIKEEYNPEKDCLFLDGEGSFLLCRPGTFAVFGPEDAHMPGVSSGKAGKVKKVVVKVKV